MSPKTDDVVMEDVADSGKKDAAKAKKDDKKNKAAADVDDLSEEDKQLKDELDLCVQRLTENDAKLYPSALGKALFVSFNGHAMTPKSTIRSQRT